MFIMTNLKPLFDDYKNTVKQQKSRLHTKNHLSYDQFHLHIQLLAEALANWIQMV